MLYLILALLVGTTCVALLNGKILWAVTAYLSAGLNYYFILRRMPASRWPSAMSTIGGTALLLVVWPFTFYTIAYVSFMNRFTVYYGNKTLGGALGENRNSFASWKEAVAFARKQARESGEAVDIFDGLRHEKAFFGAYREVMYNVLPSGDVYRTPTLGRLPQKVL